MEQELEALKRRGDELVASYGRFELATKMESAIQELADLWSLSEFEVRLLKPRKTLATSSAIKTVKDLAVGGAEKAAGADGPDHAKTFASFARQNGASGMKKAAGTAARTSWTLAKENKYVLLVAAGVTGVAATALGTVTHRELRNFNERCYERRRDTPGRPAGTVTSA